MKKTLLVILLFVLAFYSNAQVIDLSVMPLTPDSTVTGDSTNLMVQAKVFYPDSISGIQLLFGTAPDLGDVNTGTASIVYSGGKYYVSCNGELNEVVSYDAKMFFRLSQSQMDSYFYLTLIVNKIGGSSTILYWKKQDQNP
jgi:hypothetical protein